MLGLVPELSKWVVSWSGIRCLRPSINHLFPPRRKGKPEVRNGRFLSTCVGTMALVLRGLFQISQCLKSLQTRAREQHSNVARL